MCESKTSEAWIEQILGEESKNLLMAMDSGRKGSVQYHCTGTTKIGYDFRGDVAVIVAKGSSR
jgi:hypothetical protein